MKHLILAFSFILLSLGAVAQNPYITPKNVAVIAQWSKWDTASYSYSSSYINIDVDGDTTEVIRSGQISIRVAKTAHNYYIIHWSYKNPKSNSNTPKENLMNILMRECTFIYRTNEYGTFEELINWDDIRDLSNKSLDSLIRITKDPYQKNIYKARKENLQNQEAITSFLAVDLQNFHFLHGIQLSRTDTLKTESRFSNLFLPEKPFPTQLMVFCDSLNEENEYAYFTMQIDNDNEKSLPIIQATIEKLANEKMPREIKKELASFKIKETYNARIDIATGWPEYYTSERSTYIFGNMETNRIEIRRIHAE